MTSSKLLFESDVRATILARAREDAPEEVCGVLVGTRSDREGEVAEAEVVTDARGVTNIADDPTVRYELDPEETISIVEATESADDAVVGFYHSHPSSPARPSATDRAQATWVGYVYCIVSPAEDAVRAWRWTGETFERVEIVESDVRD